MLGHSRFATPHSPDDKRFHVYDVHNNDLVETRRIPQQTRNIFEDFAHQELLNEDCQTALRTAELVFSRLEAKAELAFEHLMQQIQVLTSLDRTKTKAIPVERHELETLCRFFVFIRYRNSAQYNAMLSNLVETATLKSSNIDEVAKCLHVRRLQTLTSIHAFLLHDSMRSLNSTTTCDDIVRYCWTFIGAEVCLGIASDGQEFVMTGGCIGNLDECFQDDP